MRSLLVSGLRCFRRAGAKLLMLLLGRLSADRLARRLSRSLPGQGIGFLVLPASLTNIADAAFDTCSSLTSLYFLGNPPAVGAYVFNGDNTAVVYYLPGAQGWGATFAADPALRVVLWNPVPQLAAPNFGVRTNRFGFPIAGPANALVVVEACTNVAHPIWVPLSTNRLTGGASYFADAPWTGVGNRFYRLRAP